MRNVLAGSEVVRSCLNVDLLIYKTEEQLQNVAVQNAPVGKK